MSRTNATIVASVPAGAPPAWVVAALLSIALVAVYGSALDVPFIFDDEISIVTNPSITALWPPVGTVEQPGPLRSVPDLPTAGRPLVNLSFALNYQLGGLNPTSYHAINLLLHLASSLLLWAIVRRTLRLPYFNGRFERPAGWLALAVAMLWALHPLQTEAVIYATQRTELMMAFFYLATLYCSLPYWSSLDLSRTEDQNERATNQHEGPDASTRWLALAVLSSLCGMASKEVMVSAPLVVLLFDRVFISGSLPAAIRRSWPLYAGLASTWIVLAALNITAPRSQSTGFSFGVSATEWWLTQCKVLLMYLKLVVWPAPLLLHYELPYLKTFAESWTYVVPVLLIGILAIVLLARNTPAGFLLTAIAAVLAPTFFVPVLTEMAAERRMYLPLAAIVVLLVVGGYKLFQAACLGRRSGRSEHAPSRSFAMAISAVVAALVITLGVASAARLHDYGDESILWQQVAEHQPGNYMAHYNLGMYYNRAGREPESFAELQAAVAARPNYVPALSAYSFALMNASRFTEAIETLKKAIEIEPDYVPALNNLGLALVRTGRPAEAVEVFQRAMQVGPMNAQVLSNLGQALLSIGRAPEAVQSLRIAEQLAPDDPDVLMRLGNALYAQDQRSEAVALLERVVTLRPDSAAAHSNLGVALLGIGRLPAAAEHFRRYVELNPADPGGYFNLANTLANLGQHQQAVDLFNRALKMQPDSAEGHFCLGASLTQLGQFQEAIDHFHTVIRLNPRILPAYANLVDALVKSGRTPEAIDIAKRGIEASRAAGDSATSAALDDWLGSQAADPKSVAPPK